MKVSYWLTASLWYECDSPESEGRVPSQVTSQEKVADESTAQLKVDSLRVNVTSNTMEYYRTTGRHIHSPCECFKYYNELLPVDSLRLNIKSITVDSCNSWYRAR